MSHLLIVHVSNVTLLVHAAKLWTDKKLSCAYTPGAPALASKYLNETYGESTGGIHQASEVNMNHELERWIARLWDADMMQLLQPA